MKPYERVAGHMSKLGAMPIYGKNPLKKSGTSSKN